MAEAETDLKIELRGRFFPRLHQLGFTLFNLRYTANTSRFIRKRGNMTDHVDVHWDKFGRARFNILFGSTPLDAPLQPDQPAPENTSKLGTVHYTICYLQPSRGIGTSCWYRLDASLWERIFGGQKLRDASTVVDLLLEHFREVEVWFEAGRIGPHLQQFEHQLRFRSEPFKIGVQ
jgi:hypothetical protein